MDSSTVFGSTKFFRAFVFIMLRSWLLLPTTHTLTFQNNT